MSDAIGRLRVMGDLLPRLRALRERLHKDESDGSKAVHWHPDGFTVDDAIEEIERLRKELAVAMAIVRGAQAAHDAERQHRARLAEAVDLLWQAPVEPHCDWKCGEGTSYGPCNCGAGAWQERRNAFLAKVEPRS